MDSISDKLVGKISNLLIKSEMIKKINKIDNIIVGVVLFGVMYSLTNIYYGYKYIKIYKKIEDLEGKIKEYEKVNDKILMSCEKIINMIEIKKDEKGNE